MKNHRHASCCFCARQTFIVVRKEVIFIHISRYTFCTRSCIFIGAGEKGERRARATRARAYPLAIKDGETLFKPDTALEIRPCSDHEIPSVEHNRYSDPLHRPRPRNDTTRGHASTANFFREIENEWPPRHNENLFRALPFFCARVKNRRPVFSIIFSPGKTFERFSMPKGGTKGEIPSLASLGSRKDEKVFVKRR